MIRKQHPVYSKYLIGDDGSVWSTRTGCRWGHANLRKEPMRMKSSLREGYPSVNLLDDNGKKHWKTIHLLVLETFVGPRPPCMEGAHNDGIPINCNITNLRWDTAINNNHDKYKHGTMSIGTKNGCARLTEANVMEIRALALKGFTPKMLKDRYPVDVVNIRRSMRGESWQHLPNAVPGKKYKIKNLSLDKT